MNRHIRALLSASRNLAGPVHEFGISRIILPLIFALVAVYYVIPRSQSFTIVASTQSVSVKLSKGPQHLWSLENAVMCLRHTADSTVSVNDLPQIQCDPDVYREVTAQEVEILWQPGHRLTVSGSDDRRLMVEISTGAAITSTTFDSAPVTDNSVLFFDRASFDNLGGLVTFGQVSIGNIAEAGAAKLTRGGTYQIRENLGFPSHKSLVSSGEILTGDFVRLTDKTGKDIDATMFFTRSEDPLADFDVILTSKEQPSSIEITRIGGAQASISTRWTERIANDAFPVALSIFLGLFGASLGIARSLSPKTKSSGQPSTD